MWWQLRKRKHSQISKIYYGKIHIFLFHRISYWKNCHNALECYNGNTNEIKSALLTDNLYDFKNLLFWSEGQDYSEVELYRQNSSKLC